MLSIKDMVQAIRKSDLCFTETRHCTMRLKMGFIFPVPIADAGSATFGAEEKAILLMRYIRKQLAALQVAKEAQNAM